MDFFVRTLQKNIIGISEFQYGYSGTCSEASGAMAYAAAYGRPSTREGVIAFMTTMVTDMISRHEADVNGGATSAYLAEELTRQGAKFIFRKDYNGDEGFPEWHEVCYQHAGINPIILELSEAHNLVDSQGGNTDLGVYYHTICLIGLMPDAYLCLNPNTTEQAPGIVSYSYDSLLAANPVAALILEVF